MALGFLQYINRQAMNFLGPAALGTQTRCGWPWPKGGTPMVIGERFSYSFFG